MDVHTNFGTMLKRLICFTDTKFVVLAKIVGYDVSYISKWCNNIKMPSVKYIDSINEKAAETFSKEIVEQEKVSKFCKQFFVEPPENLDKTSIESYLSKEIQKLLLVSYENTEINSNTKDEKKHEDVKLIIGNNNVISFIQDQIRNIIEESTSDIEIFTTTDICRILDNDIFDYTQKYNVSNIRIRIKVGFDMKEFEMSPDTYLKKIYNFLNKKVNCEFTFYENKLFGKSNILVIRNKIAIIYSLDSDGFMELATIIKDHKSIEEIYNKTISKFKNNYILLKPAETLGMERCGYRTNFYSSNEFQFFSANGFEFLLPSDVISTIIKKAESKGYPKAMSYLIKKLQITWEERFEKGKINFIIPKSTMMRYIENGQICYTDIPYKLSIEERKEHAIQIIESMKKNKNIRVTFLDDDLFNLESEYFKLSIYTNNKKAFMKKNVKFITNNASSFYIIVNEKFVEYLNLYFSNLRNEEFCYEYDVELLETLIDQNKNMILRMMEIQK